MDKPDLRKVGLEDIQLIRYWRNLDHVRLRMVHTKIIEKEEQQKWFNQLDLSLNNYFIYSLNSCDIGVVSVTKVISQNKSFECGIFCGDLSFLKHWINLWACIKIYNFAFEELDLEVSYATILKNNKAALRMNKALGYTFIQDQDKNISRFILTKESYLLNSKSIIRYISRFLNQEI
jgi:RimJ/RimL family protein N-acetyltransferase